MAAPTAGGEGGASGGIVHRAGHGSCRGDSLGRRATRMCLTLSCGHLLVCCCGCAQVPNDQNTKRMVENSFKSFDINKSGTVDFDEFVNALEKFGMHVAGGRRKGVGGLPIDTVRALFDKYDTDHSGALEYKEFTRGIFADDDKLAMESSQPPPPEAVKKQAKAHVCEETKYLKESNHIFGPKARGSGSGTPGLI